MSAPRILQPGEIEAFSSAIFHLHLPAENVFQARAERLRRIAPGHSLADYLGFVATIADCQQLLLDGLGNVVAPAPERIEQCRASGVPPLAVTGWERDPVWRSLARTLATAAAAAADAPAQARAVLDRVAGSEDDWLEAQASALLALDLAQVDIAASAIIGAALQVYWVRMAQGLDPATVARPEQARLCPVCGSHPTASLVHIGGSEDALRYLVCSVCASHWYLERVKCSNCANNRDIGYHTVENPKSPIRAESCPECRSYLKILYRNLTPDLDATADDLATLALDWLMSEEGYARSGVNLMLLQAQDSSLGA
jgi:FdhE protein